MSLEPTVQTVESLTNELQSLKNEQDKTMLLADYVGMSDDETKLYDERQQRIDGLYEALLVLMELERAS